MDFSKIKLVEDLPISKYEEEIAAKLLDNSNLIVIGETGSGKTTQIPLIILKTLSKLQNLVKGKIIITEPRRIAATSVANYVATLVGDELGKTVGYKIRFSEAKSNDTAMIFMTDGILLREAQVDPLLSDYSVIMVDEAHERNINSDFLIGLLVDVQRKRKEMQKVPLKILVTSATLEKDKFIKFFDEIEGEKHDIVEVPGRLFPVEMHLEERDVWDYEVRAAQVVEEICNKKSSVYNLQTSIPNNQSHNISTNSQSENELLPNKKVVIPADAGIQGSSETNSRSALDSPLQGNDNVLTREPVNSHAHRSFSAGGLINNNELDNKLTSQQVNKDSGDILIFMPGKGEIERTKLAIEELPDFNNLNLDIITVHADLPIEEQNRIFKKTDKRKVIIATNIAETSLTVPGVVYVIDSGLIKVMEFDPHTGIKSLITKEHAKKGLEQRKGRAGRIEPGVYYGLYTQKSFDARIDFPIPEILRSSLSQVILIMKIIGIEDIRNFKFIDHPDENLILTAMRELQRLGALDNDENITEKGRTMASLPLEPRLSNLIIEANKNKCIETVCTIASFLELKPVMISQTIDEIFKNKVEEKKKEIFDEDQKLEEKKFLSPNEVDLEEKDLRSLYMSAEATKSDMERKQKNLQVKGSDFFTLLNIYRMWEKANFDEYWPDTQYLNTQTLLEARNIRQELLEICDQNNFEAQDRGGSDLDYRVEKTFINAFKFNILSQMQTGFYINVRSKEKNIRIHNSSVLREDKPKFALAFEIIEISEIDAEPKLSAKFLHAIKDDLMKQLFPDIYKYEMKFQKKSDRNFFQQRNRKEGFRLKKGHVGRRSRGQQGGRRGRR